MGRARFQGVTSVTRRDPFRLLPVVSHRPGQLVGDVGRVPWQRGPNYSRGASGRTLVVVTTPLEQAYEQAMRAAMTMIRRKGGGYKAGYYAGMAAELGHLEASRQLLAKPDDDPGLGLDILWEKRLLDCSIEFHAARCQDGRFRSLFTRAELDSAERRLAQRDF